MKRHALCYLALLWVLGSMPAGAELPFATEEAETLEPGVLSIDFGVGYRDEPKDFGVADRQRQWNLGETRFSWGLGSIAELQVSGAVAQLIENFDDSDSTNNGDWVLGTKVWLLQEQDARPSVSFLFQVKLPNGSNEKGGSTDETDVLGFLLLSKQVAPRHSLHANLGIGILGNPQANAAQNDVAIVRIAWEHQLSERTRVGIEGLLQTGPKESDDPRYLQLVLAHRLGSWVVYGSAGVGLGDDADRFRADFGIRRRFALWSPDRSPVRLHSW